MGTARSRRPIPELLLCLVACQAEMPAWERDTARSATVSAASATVTSSASTPPKPKRSRRSLVRRLRKITKGRYMEGRCKKTSHPGWEDFPTERCRYSVPDATGHKSTTVIMLNPSAKRLARWIRSACRGRAESCEDEVVERILWQSSAQFPVAGIVLEDIRPTDARYEMYCFRDGVRVEVEGFETKSTDRPDDAHVKTCLEGELIQPTSFARIAGTTPGQYRAAGGKELVGEDGAPTALWLDVTRTLYQAAWKGKRNALIDAWVSANVSAAKK